MRAYLCPLGFLLLHKGLYRNDFGHNELGDILLGNFFNKDIGRKLEVKMIEKYTAEVSARKIKERIKGLLAKGCLIPLEREWVIRGFGMLWNARESDVIDFDAGFDYLIRCRAIEFIDSEKFELTRYFEAFAPEEYPAPPPLRIQINRQIRSEAENMQHCCYRLYIFENSLRNFIKDSLSEEYNEKWYDRLPENTKDEIERNKKSWHGEIPPRNLLEFTELPSLGKTISKNWEVFKYKFENIDQNFLVVTLKGIENFRNTIAHSRVLTEKESNTFYDGIERVLSAIKIFRKQ